MLLMFWLSPLIRPIRAHLSHERRIFITNFVAQQQVSLFCKVFSQVLFNNCVFFTVYTALVCGWELPRFHSSNSNFQQKSAACRIRSFRTSEITVWPAAVANGDDLDKCFHENFQTKIEIQILTDHGGTENSVLIIPVPDH